jgi:glyoxylase-like metal-dependent hydrolase (beta-lactamase superfamily II)
MLCFSPVRTASFVAVLAVLALAGCSKSADAPKEEAAAPVTPAVAESAPAQKSGNVHSFMIGELSAMALRDGGLEFPNDNKVFGVGRTPEEVAAVLGASGLPTDKLALAIQPLLVKAGDRVMLFDTGAGTNFGPGSGKLFASFTEAGIDPQSVTDIFVSHSHGDHVGGLVNAEGATNFPNASIHLSKAEWQHMSGNAKYAALIAAMKPKVAEFAPGSELIPGVVTAVEFKGHTPGHSGYLITSGADSLLFVGDTVHHFAVSMQKPEWTIAFDGDGATGSRSRADLIAQSAASGQRIYAVHFPFPGIGKFAKQGEGFVWMPE